MVVDCFNCCGVLIDATGRLSDQVDGQLRTINELNNIVSDHERTICKLACMFDSSV